ncbi:MAG TPA: CBS domain-containing protein [Micromonosporaceae bacterium]|nr:CBS domain-containing protein [Micromonosporaceae bacterium]
MKVWRVRDIMTTKVVSVRKHTTYRDAVDLLVAHHISGLPVVDDAGRVTGVISESDLMHRLATDGGPADRHRFRGRRAASLAAKDTAATAGELMSAPAVTVVPDTPLSEAARLMNAEGIKRLPVVDEAGRAVGVVARSDLLRVFLRTDSAIRDDVEHEVLRRVLAVEPGAVQVGVDNGVVDLVGRLDRRTDAELAVRLVRAVPGVVEVVDRLAYEFDDASLTRRHDRTHPFSAEPFTPNVTLR